MLSLGYRYVYAIVMSIAGLALCLRVSENSALELWCCKQQKAYCEKNDDESFKTNQFV